MPQPSEQNRSFEVKTLEQTDTSITVQVGRANETLVFTYTPPYKVAVDFPGGQAPGELEQPQIPEAVKPPEYPAITLEGNPAFANKFDPKKQTYLLRLAYHPNPKNTKEAQFYNVVASGEKAEAFYGLYITDTRMQVRVTGDDISDTVRKREGTAGTIKAESIEIIRGRKAGSEILSEKVRLADTK